MKKNDTTAEAVKDPYADFEYKDRVYKLVGEAEGVNLRFQLLCCDNPAAGQRKRLLYFDTEKGVNRSLRYVINQDSVFKDEQVGESIQEPVFFESKLLLVDKNNRALQKLLSLYHPWNADIEGNRSIFKEIKPDEDATNEVEQIKLEHDAVSVAMELDTNTSETILTHFYGEPAATMSPNEINREILRNAKINPQHLLDTVGNPLLKELWAAYKSVEYGVCGIEGGREFVIKNPKRRVLHKISVGENPYESIAEFFTTDEGIEALGLITKRITKE